MSLPGRLLDLPMGRMFVHRAGEGPPLVLLHGGLVSHYYWKPVIPELAKHYDVIALDHFGHGESDRPSPDQFAYDLPSLAGAVASAMDALAVPRAHVWGHSVGAAVAITLAARNPERIDRLVLEDAAYYPYAPDFKQRLLMSRAVGPFLMKNVFGRGDLKTHFKRAYRDTSLCDDALVDYYWERITRSRMAIWAFLKGCIDALVDNPGDPSRIQAPTLIAWGDEDRLFPLAHGKRLVTQVPGARLEVIPACGHSPHEERPDEILRAVLPFLAGEATAVSHG